MSLHDVHAEHVFRIKNGRTVKNIYELASELAAMDEEVFQHHVNEERNDFYNWVLHIVRDEHLARVFADIKDRRLMLAAVERRIQELEQPPQQQRRTHVPFHITASDYLLGIVIGAVAMLMLTRLL